MSTGYLAITALNLAIVTLGALALSRRVRLSELSPASAGLFGAALIFVGRPLTLALWPPAAVPHLRAMSLADQAPGLALFAMATAIWVAMALLVLNRAPRAAPPEPRCDAWRLDLLAVAIYATGVLAWFALFVVYVVAAGKLSSTTQFLQRAHAPGLIITPIMATLVLGSCLIAYRVARGRGRLLWFALAQTLLMIGSLGLGGRGAAFSVLLVPMLVYLAARHGGVRWVWVVALVGVLLLAGGVIWTVRAGMEVSRNAPSVVLLGLSYSLGCPYDYYQGIVHVCSGHPEEYRLGQTYAFLLIRPLRGFRRLTTSTEAPGPGARALVGEPAVGGVPATMLGEGYWNFGVPGIALAAALYGCFIGLSEWLTRAPWLPLRAVWQIYLAVAAFAVFRGWFQQVLSNHLPVWALLIIVGLLVTRRSRRPAATIAPDAPGARTSGARDHLAS